jgi:hypothetical protein
MKSLLLKLSFYIITFVSTVYILLGTWEITANTDIPFAKSIEKSNLGLVINTLVGDFGTKPDTRFLDAHAKLDDLDYIEIPALKTKLFLEDGRFIKGSWYIRPNLAGYLSLNKDTRGNTVDYLVFTKKSWISLPYTDELEVGTAVRLFTKRGYLVNFEIDEKYIKKYDEPLIVAKDTKRQIILIVDDAQNNTYYGYSLVLER